MWNHRKHLWLKQSAKHLIFFNNNKIITISYKCNLYVVCASKSRLISNCAWRLNWEWEQIGKQTILCLPGRWHIYFDFRSQFIKFSAKFYEIRKTWLPAGNYYLRKFGTENEYIVVCPETGFLQLNSSRKDQFRVEYDKEARQDIFSLYWNNNAVTVTDNNGLKIDVKNVDHRRPPAFEIRSMDQQRSIFGSLMFLYPDKYSSTTHNIVRQDGNNLSIHYRKDQQDLMIQFIEA